jgi:hypothetical protein
LVVYTDLQIYERSPEILTVLSSRCFVKDNNSWVLKPEYIHEPVFYVDEHSNECTTANALAESVKQPRTQLDLTPELLDLCLKFLLAKDSSDHLIIIGKDDSWECMEQRLENYMKQGRADIIVGEGCTGGGTQYVVSRILQQYNMSIRTEEVFHGSFGSQFDMNSRPARQLRHIVR